MPAPFSKFAKAPVVLLWSRRRVRLSAVSLAVSALRHLLFVLERRNTVSPWDLRPDDFIEALASYQRKGIRDAREMGHWLEVIAAQVDRFEITSPPLSFHNPLLGRRPLSPDVDPQDLALNDDERILLRAIDPHIALGSRIGEALTVPADCWIEEEVRDAHGSVLLDPNTGEPQRRYGIRYYPEKGMTLRSTGSPSRTCRSLDAP